MGTLTKVLIGVGAISVLGFLTKDYWMPTAKASEKNDLPPLTTGNATSEQFDELVSMAKSKGSNLFANASADQLIGMRNNFVSHLSNADANQFISLLSKPDSSLLASEKIAYSELLRKWTGAPIPAIPNVNAKPLIQMPVIPSIQTGAGYNILKDPDYSKKSDVLGKWYDYIKAENKKRLIPRIVPSKNTFVSRFIQISLADLNEYVSLATKGAANRDAKDEFSMKNLRAKYPVPFEGKLVLYSFTGKTSHMQLSNI